MITGIEKMIDLTDTKMPGQNISIALNGIGFLPLHLTKR